MGYPWRSAQKDALPYTELESVFMIYALPFVILRIVLNTMPNNAHFRVWMRSGLHYSRSTTKKAGIVGIFQYVQSIQGGTSAYLLTGVVFNPAASCSQVPSLLTICSQAADVPNQYGLRWLDCGFD